MAGYNDKEVECPKCHKINLYRDWFRINVRFEPEMKEKILDRSLFKFSCSHCDYEAKVLSSILLNDADNKYAVYYAPTMNDVMHAFNNIKEVLLSGEIDKEDIDIFRLRIVQTQDEFIEKIQIFDSGLDDRAVEITKVLTVPDLPEEMDDEEGEPDLTFFIGENGEPVFRAKGMDGETLELPMDEGLYETAVSMLEDILAGGEKDEESEYLIDFDWAADKLNEYSGE